MNNFRALLDSNSQTCGFDPTGGEVSPGLHSHGRAGTANIAAPKRRLSVITPVFNGIRFIEECIKNVTEQNCPDAEHIIVDGGSTDGTLEVIKRYACENGHISWVSERDRGQSDAMNKGIRMASGAIIGFLNVDDYYQPLVLGEVIAMFDTLPEPSLLVGNCTILDEHQQVLSVSRPSRISLLNLLRGRYEDAFPMNPSAYFYHKSLHDRIGPYDVQEHYGMDVHFMFRAVQSAQVKYVDKMWGNYRYLPGTKTFEDEKTGSNSIRVKAITEHYKKQAPLAVKLNLKVSEIVQHLYATCIQWIKK
jgi:glycosyltransferase involved in cell wall biosynthesis